MPIGPSTSHHLKDALNIAFRRSEMYTCCIQTMMTALLGDNAIFDTRLNLVESRTYRRTSTNLIDFPQSSLWI